MVRKICQLPTCNKPFIAVTHNQKYCCKKCRLIAAEERAPKKQCGRRPNPKTGQPCWRCQNATDMNKCPWSIGVLPEGCIAKRVKIKVPSLNLKIDPNTHNLNIEMVSKESYTYKILSCPLFKEDED